MWTDKPTESGVYWMATKDKGKRSWYLDFWPVAVAVYKGEISVLQYFDTDWRTIPELGIYKNRVKFSGPLVVPEPPKE